ncbi:MAG: FG-GAP-like repeat-containing protein [Pseudomonadota bacterium]|nr:FG-GAP-like repeat-containing protein [Pseudomonadota bacterium]
MLLLLSACIETGLNPGKLPEDPVGIDSAIEDTGEPPPPEVCNGEDDDADGEVDEGFPDADENGRADCLDGTCALAAIPAGTREVDDTCTVVAPIVDPWSVTELWRFGAPAEAPAATASVTQPLIVRLADDNGDGVVDAADGTDVLFATYDAAGVGWLVAVDGPTGAEHWAVSPVSAKTQIAAADLDADGAIEILAFTQDGRVTAFDAGGATRWTSTDAAPSAEDGWHVLVADLDADGAPEVIADTLILDGATGATLATLPVDTTTHQHRAPTVGDLDLDGDQEVLVAGRVFDRDGTELWYSGEGVEDGVWSALVQLDTDAEGEVITLGANLVLSDTDGTTLVRSPTFARNWSGGPCVGDFDGDGAPEFAYGAFDGFYVREMDARNVWYAPIDVSSGQAACAGYDLDADGALEVLYADEHAFRIFDGRTGAVRFEDGANYESVATYASPAVGDLDGDGDVEIVVVSSDPTLGASVLVYTHAGEGWPALTDTWPVFDYSVWNVDPDGSVPAAPAAPWLSGNGVRTTPVNPRTAPGADLVVEIGDVCIWDCTYGPTQVSVQVSNRGPVAAPAGVTLAVYAVDADGRRWVAGTVLEAVAAGAALEGHLFDLAPGDIGSAGLAVAVDEEGTVAECDEGNNEALWVEGCP